MPLDLYLAFVVATVAIIALPGPNVALIVANSIAYGPRYGLITVAGTSSAMIPQLVVTVIGMSSALTLMSHLFEWVRWLGVAYLVWLGFMAWRAPCEDLMNAEPEPRLARSMFARGFLVSLTNPKTLLFYGAFLPQFVAPEDHLAAQLAVLSATFLAIAVFLDCCWALGAARLRMLLATRHTLRNRLTASFYLAAAAGVAAARRTS